jgi:hypothetical protein
LLYYAIQPNAWNSEEDLGECVGDSRKETALHCACNHTPPSSPSSMKIIGLLLAHGADVNAVAEYTSYRYREAGRGEGRVYFSNVNATS